MTVAMVQWGVYTWGVYLGVEGRGGEGQLPSSRCSWRYFMTVAMVQWGASASTPTRG